jgi:hypothetical protein
MNVYYRVTPFTCQQRDINNNTTAAYVLQRRFLVMRILLWYLKAFFLLYVSKTCFSSLEIVNLKETVPKGLFYVKR